MPSNTGTVKFLASNGLWGLKQQEVNVNNLQSILDQCDTIEGFYAVLSKSNCTIQNQSSEQIIKTCKKVVEGGSENCIIDDYGIRNKFVSILKSNGIYYTNLAQAIARCPSDRQAFYAVLRQFPRTNFYSQSSKQNYTPNRIIQICESVALNKSNQRCIPNAYGIRAKFIAILSQKNNLK